MARLSGPSKQEMEMFEAEDDMRVMKNAEKIRKDKKRMKRMQKMAAEKAAELEAIAKGDGIQAL